eukprot:5732332-Ditylum_brightwellii.AAC.1
MGCASCVSTVSGVLEQIPRISKHDVSFETGIAKVWLYKENGREMNDSREKVMSTIITMLSDAGFPADSVDATNEQNMSDYQIFSSKKES